METRTKVIIAVSLLVVGCLAVVALKFATPKIRDWQQQATSDAKGTKGTLTVLYDNWIGYAPLCSLEMKRLMKNSGYGWNCEDDKADYAKRMERLKKHEVEFAVGTVDTDVLTGTPHGFPGSIDLVIDQSKGADALVCYKDKYANLNALKGTRGLRIAYTPQSPSHHLLKALADHFGIPEVLAKETTKIEAGGSEKAFKALFENKADCAVLWEPDVSKALEKGAGKIVKLLGTESTERLIVDVLLTERNFGNKNPDVVRLVVGNYFLALKTYRDNPELLKKEIMEAHKLSAGNVDAMLRGVEWATLQDNAEKWFGISANGTRGNEGLIATIESTVRILSTSGDFTSNPLPSKDPYRLVNSAPIQDLIKNGVTGFTVPGAKDASTGGRGLETKFTPLSAAQWQNLREVGTLRVEPVTFQSGSDALTLDGKEALDAIAEKMKHYPSFRLLIKGHTGLLGDQKANQELSQERAESVKRYLMVTYSVDANRVLALGKGSAEPLTRASDESDRGYEYRLPRVEVLLVRETL